MEKVIRRGMGTYRQLWRQVLGFAPRNELAGLGELVRALEQRLELVENQQQTQAERERSPGGE